MRAINLLTEHYLKFISLNGGCTDSSESTLAKIPHGGNHMSRLSCNTNNEWVVNFS